jgi:hypothetical protein
MKALPTVAVALLGAPLLFAAPEGPTAPQGDRLDRVEQELTVTRARVDELEDELAASRQLLDETVTYLSEQATAAREVKTMLQQVEDEGFTAGKNYQSRITLLDGWRAWSDGQQENLPGRKKKDTASQ